MKHQSVRGLAGRGVFVFGVSFVVSLLYSPVLFASDLQIPGYSLTLDGAFGAGSETATEKAYRETGSADLASRIDWRGGLQGGFGLGLRFEPDRANGKTGLLVKAEAYRSLSSNSGSVVDEDWDDAGAPMAHGEGIGAHLGSDELEAGIGVQLPELWRFRIRVGGDVWYVRFHMMSYDGFTTFTGQDSIPLYGASMQYRQEWKTAGPFIEVEYAQDKLQVRLEVGVHPWVWGDHIDHHYFKKVNEREDEERYAVFEDRVKGGVATAVKASGYWRLTEKSDVGLQVGVRFVNGARGVTRIKASGLQGGAISVEDAGGAEFRSWNVKATVRVKVL